MTTGAHLGQSASSEENAQPSSSNGGDRASSEPNPDPRGVARKNAGDIQPLTEQQELLIRRPDRKRAAREFGVPLFGRTLTLGGRYSFRLIGEENRLLDFDFTNLDDNDADGDGDTLEPEDSAEGRFPTDDRLRINQGLLLDLFYPLPFGMSVYASGRVGWANLVTADHTSESDEWIVERRESWLFFGNLFRSPLSLQVGRQRISDDREWWWDADLDAIRVRFDLARLHFQIALAEELFKTSDDFDYIDPEEKDVRRIIAFGEFEWFDKQEVAVYVLNQNDHSSSLPQGNCLFPLPPNLPPSPFFTAGCITPKFDDESDADLTWFGVSASGRRKLGRPGTLHYWIHAAGVVGHETFYDLAGPTEGRRVSSVNRHRVRGWGLDLGMTWQTKLPTRPRLTVAYAYGSGDAKAGKETDGSFRQTGLQDNNDKFRGVDSFRYYGELIDPEVSNLHIATASLGFPLFEHSSIEFVYHYYRQVEAANFVRDVEFKRDPDGRHRTIGHEWDVIIGIEEWGPLELEFTASLFRTGAAFGPDDKRLSFVGVIQARLNF